MIGLWLALTTLYFWQASNHPTPWLFSDEIEYTEIARAIALLTRTAERDAIRVSLQHEHA